MRIVLGRVKLSWVPFDSSTSGLSIDATFNSSSTLIESQEIKMSGDLKVVCLWFWLTLTSNISTGWHRIGCGMEQNCSSPPRLSNELKLELIGQRGQLRERCEVHAPWCLASQQWHAVGGEDLGTGEVGGPWTISSISFPRNGSFGRGRFVHGRKKSAARMTRSHSHPELFPGIRRLLPEKKNKTKDDRYEDDIPPQVDSSKKFQKVSGFYFGRWTLIGCSSVATRLFHLLGSLILICIWTVR